MDKSVRTRVLCRRAGVMAAASLVWIANGQTYPRTYTWVDPRGLSNGEIGTTLGTYNMVPLVRLPVNGYVTGSAYLQAIAPELRARGAGKIAITMQNYGRRNSAHGGDVFFALPFHEDDAIVKDCNPSCGATPCKTLSPTERLHSWWKGAGIAETREWFEDFAQAYVSDPTLPRPSRFHFDNEFFIADWGQLSVFDVMLRCDPRAGTETVTGFETTLRGVYAAAGSPAYCCSLPSGPDHPQNRAWVNWHHGVNSMLSEGAMEASTYDVIDRWWNDQDGAMLPRVLTSDYYASCRIDEAHALTHTGRQGSTWLNNMRWQGKASLQAPFLYEVACEHRVGTESPWDASVRVNRNNLEACIESFGGGHQHELTPWIALPKNEGESHYYCVDGPFDLPELSYPAKEDTRRLLMLLRSKDIQEFMIWSGNDINLAPNWRRVQDAIDQVWGASLLRANVTTGRVVSEEASLADDVRFALKDAAVLADDETTGTLVVEAGFGTSFRNVPESLQVVVESTAGIAGVIGRVELRMPTTGTWVPVGPWFDVATFGNGQRRVCVDGASRYLGADGAVQARVTYRRIGGGSGFSVQLDLIQLSGYGGTPLYGDFDRRVNAEGRYTVDEQDIAWILERAGEKVVVGSQGDFDHDGYINGQADITLVFNEFGASKTACGCQPCEAREN